MIIDSVTKTVKMLFWFTITTILMAFFIAPNNVAYKLGVAAKSFMSGFTQ